MKKDELNQKIAGADGFNTAASADKLSKWFPELSAEQVEHLVVYLGELNKFNKALNLVSPQTLKNAEAVHVADSVYASRHIRPLLDASLPLYDFGSGNGCPGIIIAALFPELKVVLIDRDERKLEFCKHVINALGLSNIETALTTVESLPLGSIRQAVARGFAPLSKALIKYRNQFPAGGKFFHMKGDGWANEVAGLPSQVFSHWAPSLVGKYKIPESSVEMFVVLTEKTTN